jgi:transcriptional regulator with XRE-family HTH domain
MTFGEGSAESIGALLARVRVEHGISQLRLAERLCAASGLSTVTRSEVSRWEREERIPSGFWLGWLALVLDLPLRRLERATAVARHHRRRRSARDPRVIWVEQSAGVYVRAAS